MVHRHLAMFVGAILLVPLTMSCGSTNAEVTTTTAVTGTVAGIGDLPTQPLDTTVAEGLSSNMTRQLTAGEMSSGPRLLMIGDSIFAALSRRYGNMACDRLVPMGWQVAVEAERGRFIDLGLRIVKKKLPQGFDAAIIFLGTNYGKKQDVYQEYLDKILDELAPRPVIILTATEYKPFMTQVNAVIEEEVRTRENLWLVDWKNISKTPGVLYKDGIHPVDFGNVLLMDSIIEVLGVAPGSAPGECLKVEFKDDAPLSNLPPSGTVVDTTAPDTSTTSIAGGTSVPANGETTSTIANSPVTTIPVTTIPAMTTAPSTPPSSSSPPA